MRWKKEKNLFWLLWQWLTNMMDHDYDDIDYGHDHDYDDDDDEQIKGSEMKEGGSN